MEEVKKKPRGFAAISAERRAEIARMGGTASQASGRAYKFTSEKAKIAGAIGGRAKKKGGAK